MSSCCQLPAQASTAVSCCPTSGTKGKLVENQTVKALLTDYALRRFAPTIHYFCPASNCEVVYFDASGSTYMKADVRARVRQKEPFGDRTVCYCFGENEADIRREIEGHGTSAAVERVRSHIQAGRCACEVRNPRGVCCLGDVVAAVQRAEAAIRTLVR